MFPGLTLLLLIPCAVILSPAAAIYLAVRLTSRRAGLSRPE